MEAVIAEERQVADALRSAGAQFALVHGSRAGGRARPDSDLDVGAWWGGRAPASWEVDVPHGVDLVVLDTAQLWLSGRIAQEGRLLFDDDRRSWAGERNGYRRRVDPSEIAGELEDRVTIFSSGESHRTAVRQQRAAGVGQLQTLDGETPALRVPDHDHGEGVVLACGSGPAGRPSSRPAGRRTTVEP